MGQLSRVNDSRRTSNIKMMRDTGASQSLVLKNQLSKQIDIKGKRGEPMKIPIHRTDIKSKWISEMVAVGVINRLSIEGVDMLMGNDLAKSKVEITYSPRRLEMQWAPKLDPDKKGTRVRIVTCTQAKHVAERRRKDVN